MRLHRRPEPIVRVAGAALLLLVLASVLACGLVVSFDQFDVSQKRFGIQGSVDGLYGATATLTLNGDHPMPVVDGHFAFPPEAAVVDGESYVVTAASPPDHVCRVDTHGADRIAGADATVAVHCPSTVNTLRALTLSVAPLAPVFDPSVGTYTASAFVKSILTTTTTTTVTATATDPRAGITVAGAPVASGTPSADIPLREGPTPLEIIVTAADGTIHRYTIVVAGRINDYLKASNTRVASLFGVSVALSGDTLAVGADGEWSSAKGIDGNQNDTSAANAGAVYVFTRVGSTWSQQAYIKPSNTRIGIQFGTVVALSGDTLAVGSYYESSNATGIGGNQDDASMTSAGAVYVFTRAGSTWSQQAYIKASNTRAYAFFGSAVALSGDTLAVGAEGESSNAAGTDDTSAANAGAVYVFTRAASAWSQQAYVKASNNMGGALFGHGIALEADTLVVGANGESSSATGINGQQSDTSAQNAGAAYVFTRAGSAWSQQAYVKASNTRTHAEFGSAVALSGGTLAVGADWESSNATGINGNQSDTSAQNAGAVYVY